MATFDRAGAKAAGYTDQEINDFMASMPKPAAPANPLQYIDRTDPEALVRSAVPAPSTPQTPASSGFFDLSPVENTPSFAPAKNLFSSSPVVTPGGVSIPNIPGRTSSGLASPLPSNNGMDNLALPSGWNLLGGDPNKLKLGGY